MKEFTAAVSLLLRSTRSRALTRRTATCTRRLASRKELRQETSLAAAEKSGAVSPTPSQSASSHWHHHHHRPHRHVISSSSLQAQRGSLVQLGGGQRPQEGSHQTDEVPDEAANAAVGQGQGIHPRSASPPSHWMQCRSCSGSLLPGSNLLLPLQTTSLAATWGSCVHRSGRQSHVLWRSA